MLDQRSGPSHCHSSSEHLATLVGHSAAAQIPDRTTKQQAQVGPQLSTCITTARVLHSVVPHKRPGHLTAVCQHQSRPAGPTSIPAQLAAPLSSASKREAKPPPAHPSAPHPHRRAELSSTQPLAMSAQCSPGTNSHGHCTAPQCTMQLPSARLSSDAIQPRQSQTLIALAPRGDAGLAHPARQVAACPKQ